MDLLQAQQTVTSYAGRAYSLSIQAARVASFIAASGTAIVYGTEMSS